MTGPKHVKDIVGSYFRERVLWYETSEAPRKYQVSSGVPQGSVLGPILWNIMYNGILNVRRPRNAELHCFADDVAITAVNKTLPALQITCNETIRAATRWLESVGLEIAAHKTEVVLLSSRKAVESLQITVEGVQLESARSLKYLGVMIDHRLSFSDHVQYASRKAAMTTTVLGRLMPNVGGPRMPARKLLVSVAKATLLYAAPIWSRVTMKPSHLREARAAYRTMALRLIRGFRTISEDASLVLAGMLPVDLEIKALTQMREGANRTMVYERQVEEWQTRWQTSRKGRWTFELIPNIATWICGNEL